jgi:hypothetical protein
VWAVLEERGVVTVQGADARTFLHNVLTADIEGLVPLTARHAALLTPQGKVLFDAIVHVDDTDDGHVFYLDVNRGLITDLLKRLSIYKLRAKVTLTDQTDSLAVMALWGGQLSHPSDLGIIAPDPRLASLGWRAIVHASQPAALADAAGAVPASHGTYHAHRIAHGIADIGKDFAPGSAFPHELNMDQLGGVDFQKGCYVGQEVVSRMQHRGTARTRMVPVSYAGGFGAEAGVPVMAGDLTIGTTGSSTGGQGVALLRLDRAADAAAAGVALTAGGIAIDISKPAWWQADWPLTAGQK